MPHARLTPQALQARSLPTKAAATALLLLGLWALGACSSQAPPAPFAQAQGANDAHDKPPARPWKAPASYLNLLDAPQTPVFRLDLGPAVRAAPCHELLENEEGPRPWPWAEAPQAAAELGSCQPEAFEERPDGSRLILYALARPEPQGPMDARLVAYAPQGAVQWHYRLNRSAQGKNFSANFRSSFLATLAPRLACAGTLWEGGTQLACLELDTGKLRHEGTLPFWSAVIPRPLDTSLVAADLAGLTRRYPYSGAEMRYRPFGADGGRAAFYASDRERIYFASPQHTPPRLEAYAIKDFALLWQQELESLPRAAHHEVFDALNLLMIYADGQLHALEADSGRLLWSARVGQDPPSLAATPKALWVVTQLAGHASLFELDPATGIARWRAPLPPGFSRVAILSGQLLVRSVRTAHLVLGAAPGQAAEAGGTP